MNLDANTRLRGAVRRLMAALAKDAIEVTILRQDLELVMLRYAAHEEGAVPSPNMHPAQR